MIHAAIFYVGTRTHNLNSMGKPLLLSLTPGEVQAPFTLIPYFGVSYYSCKCHLVESREEWVEGSLLLYKTSRTYTHLTCFPGPLFGK